MNNYPYSSDNWRDESEVVRSVSLVPAFGEEHIKPLFVIVECWEHKRYGHGKRAWLKEFTEQERRTITRYHSHLYTFCMRTGIPRQGVRMSLLTFALLQRAANLFASI
jgi:hypothetical protein